MKKFIIGWSPSSSKNQSCSLALKVLLELQRLFVHLEWSPLSCVSAGPFFRSIQNWSSKSYDFGKQEDPTEFADDLIEAMEQALKEDEKSLTTIHSILRGTAWELVYVPACFRKCYIYQYEKGTKEEEISIGTPSTVAERSPDTNTNRNRNRNECQCQCHYRSSADLKLKYCYKHRHECSLVGSVGTTKNVLDKLKLADNFCCKSDKSCLTGFTSKCLQCSKAAPCSKKADEDPTFTKSHLALLNIIESQYYQILLPLESSTSSFSELFQKYRESTFLMGGVGVGKTEWWIFRKPQYLQFSLKRSQWESSSTVKLNHFLRFPLSLDISQWSVDPKEADDDFASSSIYDLESLLVHSGEDADVGHYWTLIRRREEVLKEKASSEWWLFDDRFVRLIPIAQIDFLFDESNVDNPNTNWTVSSALYKRRFIKSEKGAEEKSLWELLDEDLRIEIQVLNSNFQMELWRRAWMDFTERALSQIEKVLRNSEEEKLNRLLLIERKELLLHDWNRLQEIAQFINKRDNGLELEEEDEISEGWFRVLAISYTLNNKEDAIFKADQWAFKKLVNLELAKLKLSSSLVFSKLMIMDQKEGSRCHELLLNETEGATFLNLEAELPLQVTLQNGFFDFSLKEDNDNNNDNNLIQTFNKYMKTNQLSQKLELLSQLIDDLLCPSDIEYLIIIFSDINLAFYSNLYKQFYFQICEKIKEEEPSSFLLLLQQIKALCELWDSIENDKNRNRRPWRAILHLQFPLLVQIIQDSDDDIKSFPIYISKHCANISLKRKMNSWAAH